MSTSEEHVLVIPRAWLDECGSFQGFSTQVDRYQHLFFEHHKPIFMPRAKAEEDPSYKQLIPYCLFYWNDSFFRYKRGSGGGESRLHAKQSLGIGGHISQEDLAFDNGNLYEQGMRRELEEEVTISSKYSESLIGLINDDSSPVGQVHLGMVHLFKLEEPLLSPNESDLQDAGFHSVDKVRKELDHYETWSQIAFKALEETLLKK
ncbi:Phosphoesterase [Planctomycetales bacterium 10988]|nr:Phosphoesterase [Planctomycetales bacterium 10988]